MNAIRKLQSFKQIVVGKLGSHVPKNETGLLSYTITKINSNGLKT